MHAHSPNRSGTVGTVKDFRTRRHGAAVRAVAARRRNKPEEQLIEAMEKVPETANDARILFELIKTQVEMMTA